MLFFVVAIASNCSKKFIMNIKKIFPGRVIRQFSMLVLLFGSLVLHAQAPGATHDSATEKLHFQKKPTHVGVIMDGNGRWGKQKFGHRTAGHKHANKAVEEIIRGCLEQDVPYLTLYAFSTENWNRPPEEVKTIFNVIADSTTQQLDLFMKHNIKFNVIGDTTQIPSYCLEALQKAIEATKNHTKLSLTVAINYGGKAETIAASQAIARDCLNKAVHTFLNQGFNSATSLDQFIQFIATYQPKVTPKKYEKHLNSGNLPPIDLIIRTGGRKRLSNFLPWQGAYSEVYFSELLWPNFRKKDFIEALYFYEEQHRTFGSIS